MDKHVRQIYSNNSVEGRVPGEKLKEKEKQDPTAHKVARQSEQPGGSGERLHYH